MYIVFYSTSHVFESEERFKEKGIECRIVPTPVTDKAYCGVCVFVKGAMELEDVLEGIEYSIVD